MLLVFAFLFLFSLFCAFKSYMNKSSIFFLVIMWSLIGLLYATLMRVSMHGNYSALNGFYYIDHTFFLSLVKRKLSFFTTVRLINFFTAVYLTTALIFIQVYVPRNHIPLKKAIVSYGLPILLALCYIGFYDPDTVYRIYRNVAAGHIPFLPIQCLDLLFTTCIVLALIYPLYFLIKKYKQLISVYEKKRLVGIGAFVLCSEILWYLLYHISRIRIPYFKQDYSSIILTFTSTINYHNSYTLVILALIICMFLSVLNFHIIRQDGLIQNLIIRKQTRIMNENFQKTFHSVKNVIFTYKLLLDRAIAQEGDAREELLYTLSDKIESYLNHLSVTFSSENDPGDLSLEPIFVSDLLDDTIRRLELPTDITVEKDYAHHQEEVCADSFYLSDALLNILLNAVQAIEAAERGNGSISVSVGYEFDWVIITISDNGIGMTRKEQKSIFTPFFTTKSRINSWGVGLAYTASMIKYHKGKISFKSKKGKGSIFYILLPAKKNNGKKLNQEDKPCQSTL